MSPPSYPHRHLLLSNLLADQPAARSSSYTVDSRDNDDERGAKLDFLLLSGWATASRKGKEVDRDSMSSQVSWLGLTETDEVLVLHHAENLRLKSSDFEVLGRVGEGQFGVVGSPLFDFGDSFLIK
jgi:hypothetical protein